MRYLKALVPKVRVITQKYNQIGDRFGTSFSTYYGTSYEYHTKITVRENLWTVIFTFYFFVYGRFGMKVTNICKKKLTRSNQKVTKLFCSAGVFEGNDTFRISSKILEIKLAAI